ncbi:type II secretion system F family protein [Cohnella cellulosilytica]|uniref:Type II secretion system F family protein n=1 Tax=Cohnella cellulosilytica TaxID=986710 RepID=A0ABW2FFF5_9BACL
MTDYSSYRLSAKERGWAICVGCAACFAIVWLLYRNSVIAAAAAPFGLLYPKYYALSLCRRRKDKLRQQFKDALQALASLLSAGRSVENAFAALEGDLVLLIGDSRSDLIKELRGVANRLNSGEQLETALQDLAARSDLEEVRNFAEAIAICKRAGGDLIEVTRRTSLLISEKMDVELEVSVLIAQKRFEARLMMVMPFAFVGILGFLAADYMQPMREGMGIVMLTVCLLLLALCSWWMLQIMDIKL